MYDIFNLQNDLSRVSTKLAVLIERKEITSPSHRIKPEFIFSQSWGDTSCGFGGMAGQAITNAYTIILKDQSKGNYYVFINGEYAYPVSYDCELFKEDLKKMRVSGKLYSKYKKPESIK